VRREVGMVFQHFNLFPHLTVLANCTLAPMWVRGMPRKDAEALARHYLARVRIPEQADKYPASFPAPAAARGDRAGTLHAAQDHAVRRADLRARPEMVKEVLDTMVELAMDGMTMLVVTTRWLCRQVASRMVLMDAGQIIEVNTPRLLHQPAARAHKAVPEPDSALSGDYSRFRPTLIKAALRMS